jgi:SEC-C motif-containing protein
MMRLSERCPCNSGREYRQCCSPFVKGQRPLQNAELLLRARFCAKILNLTKFLMDTWHSSTRPKKIEELPFDLRGFKIISSERKKECDYISFSIYLRIDGTINEFTVRSQFKQESGNWFFLNEEILKAEPIEDTSKPLPSEILKLYKMAEAGVTQTINT